MLGEGLSGRDYKGRCRDVSNTYRGYNQQIKRFLSLMSEHIKPSKCFEHKNDKRQCTTNHHQINTYNRTTKNQREKQPLKTHEMRSSMDLSHKLLKWSGGLGRALVRWLGAWASAGRGFAKKTMTFWRGFGWWRYQN